MSVETPTRPEGPAAHEEGDGCRLQWAAIAVLALCWLAEAFLG
jgi:hypothetical protein